MGVTRIHIEEDAGKLLHTAAGGQIGGSESSLVDYNRAGVPLIEIVGEPDMRGPEDAEAYLAALKEILRYLGVSDCNMEEGSLRCDANVSVMKKGSKEFGTRAEVKNMNSFKNVAKAMEVEVERQVELIEAGGKVQMATRGWDADKGETRAMRSKEEAHDYRYFPEPDLVPLVLDAAFLKRIQDAQPVLPQAMRQRLMAQYGIPDYDAGVLSAQAALAAYFEAVAAACSNGKAASNWVMGELSAALNKSSARASKKARSARRTPGQDDPDAGSIPRPSPARSPKTFSPRCWKARKTPRRSWSAKAWSKSPTRAPSRP